MARARSRAALCTSAGRFCSKGLQPLRVDSLERASTHSSDFFAPRVKDQREYNLCGQTVVQSHRRSAAMQASVRSLRVSSFSQFRQRQVQADAKPGVATPRHSHIAERAVQLPLLSRCRPVIVSASAAGTSGLPAPQAPHKSFQNTACTRTEPHARPWASRLRLCAGIALCLVLFATTSGAAYAATADASKGWLSYMARVFMCLLDPGTGRA